MPTLAIKTRSFLDVEMRAFNDSRTGSFSSHGRTQICQLFLDRRIGAVTRLSGRFRTSVFSVALYYVGISANGSLDMLIDTLLSKQRDEKTGKYAIA
jgi:hypothetical protein